MKNLGKTALFLSLTALLPLTQTATAQANDIASNGEVVGKITQAVQQKDWFESAKLASAAIDSGKLSKNEMTAAVNNLCVALTLKRAYVEALVACNQGVALTPDRVSAYINRGNLYSEMDKAYLAKADYAKAKTLAPDNAVVDSNLASMRWKEEHSYVALLANY